MMKVKQLLENMTRRQRRSLYLKLLWQRAEENRHKPLLEGEAQSTSMALRKSSIIKIQTGEDKFEKFAVTPDQRDKLIKHLKSVEIKQREVVGEDGETSIEEYEERVAESADPAVIKEELLDGIRMIDPAKATKLESFIGGEGAYSKPGISGLILDALKLIVMDAGGIDSLTAELFAITSAPDVSGEVPNPIDTPAVLQPLFNVEWEKRGDTMGRGEILLAFSFAESDAEPGGEYDCTLTTKPFPVKDVRGFPGK